MPDSRKNTTEKDVLSLVKTYQAEVAKSTGFLNEAYAKLTGLMKAWYKLIEDATQRLPAVSGAIGQTNNCPAISVSYKKIYTAI